MATQESTVSEIPKITAKDIKYDETPIGRGGYGYVYRGVHKDLGTVAIKTMIADGLLPARHLRIFRSEGKKLWELKHSSIVRLLGLIMEEGNYSLVLEYMHFGSLTAFRSDFFDIDWSLMVSIIRDVIHGMDYLHGMDPPILHLDLKSDNILINRRIRAKITDFGLSQWKTMTRTMTRGGTSEEKGRKGTVTHVPPEVWNNINTPPNKAYDAYSFGIVLWETVCGDRPFARVNDDVIPKAVLSGQRPDMTMVPSTCPKEVVNMMTASWVQQPDKRLEFSAMVSDIDKLFEKMAPSVPDALGKLEKEIQNLYSAEDLGGDTAATADSESLFDAATKLTKPLTSLSSTSPQSVEMEDVGEEQDVPMTTDPRVPDSERQPIVGLQEEETSRPAVPRTDASSSAPPAAKPGPSQPSQQSSQTQAKTPGTPASQTQPKTAATTPAQTPAQTPPAVQPFVISEEQKKALRRVLRDPVGMLLMHKDAHLCRRVFGVDLELQKKIKDSGELLKLLEQDPLLRVELQRKGPDHIGWMFNPHRMKDEIRRKRPARTPKPEAVERMRKLREERQKRESKELPNLSSCDDPKERKSGGLKGFMNMFKKDKHKHKMMKDPMSRYMDPYMDPMADLMAMKMGMGMAPDMSYRLKRALRDPKMVRYMLREETPPRITPVDREVMEVLQDPDKLLYMMNQDPSLMETLMMTDKDAFMKVVARARGGPPRMRYMRDMMDMRGPRRMRAMYGGLERDMMDMDLEDEMMMMRDYERHHRHRHDRELMEMLKRPGLPSDHRSSSKPSSTVSKPPAQSPKTNSSTATTTTTTASVSSSATSTSSGPTSPASSKAATTTATTAATTTAATTTATTAATTQKSPTSGTAAFAQSTTTNNDSVASGTEKKSPIEPDRPEIKSLPDDHLVKRQENIKHPVQRNTDTEPLQTIFGGLQKGFLNIDGATSRKSESSTDPPKSVSTTQTAQTTSSSTSDQGEAAASGHGKKSEKGKSKSDEGKSSGSAQGQQPSSGQGQSSGSGHGQSQSGGGSGTFRSSTSTGPNFGQQEPTGPDEIQIKLNPDGTVTGNFNPLDLPPGIQFGENNTMFLDRDDGNIAGRSSAGASGQRKRSQEYKSKWKKLSKKHRTAGHGRRDEITFDHVDLIAEHIGRKWKDLGEELDMKPSKLREMEIEYKMNKEREEDNYDYCVQVLEDLMTRKPYYTLQELIHTLKEINCQKIAIRLIEYIE